MSDQLFDELHREADASLEEAAAIPEHWGYVVELAEGEEFGGRFRRTEVDDRWAPARSVYLLVDRDGARCFIRGGRKVLDSRMEKASPGEGDWILIKRGEDGTNAQGQPYHNYAAVARLCDEPLPAEPEPAEPKPEPELEPGRAGHDDIPF